MRYLKGAGVGPLLLVLGGETAERASWRRGRLPSSRLSSPPQQASLSSSSSGSFFRSHVCLAFFAYLKPTSLAPLSSFEAKEPYFLWALRCLMKFLEATR